jgi:protein TonB
MRERSDFSLAMIASVLLHGGLLAAVMLARPWEHQLPIGAVVPVNIVSNSEFTDLRAAAEAAREQAAETPAPVPEAPPAPAEPAPQPLPKPVPPAPPPPPAPAPPKPVPTPTPKPAVEPKAQAKPAAKPEKSLDLDALAASIARTSKASSAARGPARPETALQARPAAGAARGLSANALSGLAGELQRRWNPNCEVEGGRDVQVRVTFTMGPGGQLLGQVEAGGLEQSPNPVVKAAAERAIRAVHQAAPFSAQYRDAFGQKVTVNFNGREACA